MPQALPDTYEVCSVADAVSEHVPEAEDYSNGYEDDYSYLVIRYASDGHKVLGSDGGEPEDQTLYRNWAWVPEALQEAYDRGVQYGKEHGGCCC